MKLYLKKLLFWAVAFLIGMNLLGAVKLNILAKEPDPLPCTRYYKSVLISEGDSLWKIASQYCPDGVMTESDYVYELKQINGLKDDTIHSGCYLIVICFEFQPESSQKLMDYPASRSF